MSILDWPIFKTLKLTYVIKQVNDFLTVSDIDNDLTLFTRFVSLTDNVDFTKLDNPERMNNVELITSYPTLAEFLSSFESAIDNHNEANILKEGTKYLPFHGSLMEWLINDKGKSVSLGSAITALRRACEDYDEAIKENIKSKPPASVVRLSNNKINTLRELVIALTKLIYDVELVLIYNNA